MGPHREPGVLLPPPTLLFWFSPKPSAGDASSPRTAERGLGGRAVGDLHLRLSPLGHGRGLWMDVLLGWGAGLAGQDAPSGDPGDQASFLLGRLA